MHIDKKLLRNLFLIAAGCVILSWFLLNPERVKALSNYIWDLLSPFVVGAAIAFVFNVPMRAIENQLDGIPKAGLRRGLAILLTLATLVLIIFFVVELLVPQIQLTIDSLKITIPAFFKRTADSLMVFLEENPELRGWLQNVPALETIDWPNLAQKLLTFLGGGVSSLAGTAVNAIGSVTSALVDLVISIVFAIYCLGRKDILARQGKRILYAILPEHTTDEIVRVMRLTNTTFSNFISGQCLEACILGGLFAVSMAVFKMPYIPLVSVIIALTALVPIVGAFVGCIVGAFFILVNNPFQAVTFIIMFLVIQQLEGNLIYPRVVGTSVGLPGMWVLLAVTIGGDLMGVGGMLVMIPLTSVLYTLLGEFTAARISQRNIPPEKLENTAPKIQSRFAQNKERKQQLRFKKMQEKLRRLYLEKKK